ncbi:MAG: glycosyltransferase family 9 protein [Verrucomicrobiota bacterium]|jgi:heptosyltransferase-2
MSSSGGKMLVIRGGAIGDFILTLPAIAALRNQFPGAHLEVLGYPHIVQLAVAGGLVDRVQSIEARALAGFFARGGALEPDLADYFSEFDLIVSYLYDPDEIFRTNVSRCSRAQFIAGPHRPDECVPLHAAKVYLKPLERLAIFDADPVPRLALDSQPATVGRVALHPGSGAEKKNWPENKWADLVQHLLEGTSLGLMLTGGEAEGERLQRLAAALPPARVSVAQSLPLPELARKLQPCTAFIGHDTGISHLSAALGLPGLVLWGETAEAIWRPPQKNVVIVKDRSGLKTLSVSQVLLELTALLNRNAET